MAVEKRKCTEAAFNQSFPSFWAQGFAEFLQELGARLLRAAPGAIHQLTRNVLPLRHILPSTERI